MKVIEKVAYQAFLDLEKACSRENGEGFCLILHIYRKRRGTCLTEIILLDRGAPVAMCLGV